MKKKFLIFVFFILLIGINLILTACSECHKDSDCNDNNPKTKDVCDLNKCYHYKINLDEKPKQTCNCPTNKYKFLENKCIKGKCYLYPKKDINSNLITNTFDIKSSYFRLDGNIKLKNPFNVDSDYINIDLYSSNINNDIKKINIKSVDIMLDNSLIGELIINKPIWKLDESINLEIPINENTLSDREIKVKKLIIIISFEYFKEEKNELKKYTSSKKIYLNKEINFINPEMNIECNNQDCNDNNPATIDLCIDEHRLVCKHIQRPGFCGNNKCDNNENSCTCPQDCGYCEGKLTEYTRLGCKNKVCYTYLDPNTIQELPLSYRLSMNSYANFIININTKNPIKINRNYINFSFTLLDAKNNIVYPIVINRIILKDYAGIKIADKKMHLEFNELKDNQKIDLLVRDFELKNKYEETKKIKAEIYFSYTYKDTKENEYQKETITYLTFTKPLTFVKSIPFEYNFEE